MQTSEPNDAALVAESLDGSRDAFRQIVERYQTLICSVAYGATGSISQSEDMAQETFLAAWKDLRLLREPAKLRAWLCGIVRGRIYKSFRRDGHEPAHNAATLEEIQETPACEALPSEQAISREEEAILWRSLERIPELYREPLILFYRRHQSIEQVATELELTEDAVKQRLSRGRKLLQEEVQNFVEGALCRTAPGQAFSGAVMAALPMAMTPIAAAGIGAGAKGTAAAKWGFLAVWLAPFAGFLAGFAAQWVVIRETTVERERFPQYIRLIVTWILMLGIPIASESSVRALGEHFEWSDSTRFVTVASFWCLWCLVLAAWLIASLRREIAIRLRGSVAEPRMSRAKAFLVGAGCHLCIFSWVISLAWREGDVLGTALVSGAAAILAAVSFLRLRGKAGLEVVNIAYSQLALCWAVVVVTINLRLDVWAARKYGVSVEEVHKLLPFWIVPTMTVVFAFWVIVLLAITKPKAQPQLQKA